MIKIFNFAKKYLALIKEGCSFKDKIVIAFYTFNFILNHFSKKKFHNLICDVTLKNKEGIFFCGNNIFSVWTGSSFHEPHVKKYFNLKEGVFIDVGANIGKYTISVGRKLGDKGKVIAIEPMPENFEILKKNIDLNNLNNVVPIRCALGSKEGSQYLYLDNEGRGGGAHSLLRNNHHITKNKIKVEVRKLDNVLKELN